MFHTLVVPGLSPTGGLYHVFAFSSLGMADDHLLLAAVAIDVIWSAVVAGAVARSATSGAFRACVRAMSLRSVGVARVCEFYS